ncbi:MAG: hypothetical protein HFH79_06060 [Lachnospiraceae bacterium]|nr:hypothetical protein C804_05506 [Lachnospiraceae bacterium A4]MCI8973143.1 hypothetical protein [Lachnospiraceae bacterium]
MLGKLIKYEWKGLRFPLMIMMIVLAGTMILTCGVILTINPKLDETLAWYSVMALMLSIFLYYFGIIGCTLGTTLIVVVRFYKTCYTDQGYLTHTLPVTPHQLLNSKILTAIFTHLLMIFAIILSIFIILQVGIHHVFSFIPDYSYAELRHEFSIVFADILDSFEDEFGLRLGLYIAYLLFYCIVGVISNVITLFGCVSLGQLYAKHRIVGAIAAYFLLQFVMMIIGYITAIPMYTRMLAGTYYDNATVFGIMSPTMNMSLLTTVLLAVAMYFVNLHMMTKKLNLE